MALPTTRFERFLYRRNRYIQRGKRQARRGKIWEKQGLWWHAVGRKWEVVRGPRQDDYLKDGALRVAGTVDQGAVLPVAVTVTEPKRGEPPHVKLTLLGAPLQAVLGYALNYPVANYHRRHVLTTRWQPSRRTKRERQDWGARRCAFYNNFWPDWDPWGRRPNQTDVANGADPVIFETFPPPAVGG